MEYWWRLVVLFFTAWTSAAWEDTSGDFRISLRDQSPSGSRCLHNRRLDLADHQRRPNPRGGIPELQIIS